MPQTVARHAWRIALTIGPLAAIALSHGQRREVVLI